MILILAFLNEILSHWAILQMDLLDDLCLHLLFYNLYCSNLSVLLITYISCNWITMEDGARTFLESVILWEKEQKRWKMHSREFSCASPLWLILWSLMVIRLCKRVFMSKRKPSATNTVIWLQLCFGHCAN